MTTEATAETQQQQAPPQPEIQPEPDFFAEELAQLKREEAAEQARASGGEGTYPQPSEAQQFEMETDGTTIRQPSPTAPAVQPSQPPAPIMVPIQRLNEETGKYRAAQDQIAYLQGQIDALLPAKPPAADATDPRTTSATDPLADIIARKVDLAEEYEAANITFADYVKKAAELDKDMMLTARQQGSHAQPAISGDEIIQRIEIEAVMREQESSNPWVWVFNDEDFSSFAAQAAVALAARGYTPQTPGYQAERLRVAGYFAQQQGPHILGITQEQAHAEAIKAGKGAYTGRKVAAGGSPAGGSPQSGGAKPLTPQQQARASKLDLASRMPPNFSGSPTAAPPAPISEAQIREMSDDEIVSLPAEVRRRVLSQL